MVLNTISSSLPNSHQVSAHTERALHRAFENPHGCHTTEALIPPSKAHCLVCGNPGHARHFLLLPRPMWRRNGIATSTTYPISLRCSSYCSGNDAPSKRNKLGEYALLLREVFSCGWNRSVSFRYQLSSDPTSGRSTTVIIVRPRPIGH